MSMTRPTLLIGVLAGFLALAAAPAKAVDIQEITTPKGVTYWLVEDDTADLVSMSFLFRGGSTLVVHLGMSGRLTLSS